MKILIDIGHPAHVHNFRNLAKALIAHNHKVVWTAKDIVVAKRLLDYYGFSYYTLPKKKDSLLGKSLNQLKYNWYVWRICRKERIDIAIGTSVSIAHVSKISKVKAILFDDDDDEVQPFVTKYVNPFANTLLSPTALKGKRKQKDTVFYKGYHELAYLHPSVFSTDERVLKNIDIEPGERFFIMRFNVFKAHHDVGVKGLSLDQKLKIIKVLEPHGKILITTEREIEPELSSYQLKVAPEHMHSLMSYAAMFVGDSQTMVSEAAILGTPAIKCNSFVGKLSVPNEIEEKYELCYSFLPEDFDNFMSKLEELLIKPNLKQEWSIRRQKMLEENINVTDFWTWFVANYPQSVKIMQENTDYQFNFK